MIVFLHSFALNLYQKLLTTENSLSHYLIIVSGCLVTFHGRSGRNDFRDSDRIESMIIQNCKQCRSEDESLSECTEMSVETIIILLRFCLISSTFMYGGQHYRQIHGMAMGSPVSRC